MESAACLAFLQHFGLWEILLILAILLLLFGATRIPEVAKSFGRGVNEFKKGLKGEDSGGGPPAAGDGKAPPAVEEKRNP
jgi:sec-independent protein translocase protein TatA